MVLLVATSRMLATAGLGGARPFLTTLVVASYARFALHARLPGDLAWMIHPYALVAFGVFAVAEHLVWHDPDAAEMLQTPMRLVTAVLAFWNTRFVAALGTSGSLAAAAPSFDGPSSLVAGIDAQQVTRVGVMLLGTVVALLSLEVRTRFVRLLHDALIPRRWVRWLECGGVVGALVAVLLSPVLAVVLAVVLGALSVAVGGAATLLLVALDRRSRRSCSKCSTLVRVEATRCRTCGASLTPTRWLAGPPSGAL